MWILITSLIALLSLKLPASFCQVSKWQGCDPTVCYGCYNNHAYCSTNSSTKTVPQDMVLSLTSLEVKYTAANGSGGCLYHTDVKRYLSLESLHLFKDFNAIHPFALISLSNLSWLHLENTLMQTLPDHLLAYNSMLTRFQLIQNHFSHIPLNAFTEKGAKAVNRLSFHAHRNAFLPCANNSLILPSEFKQFVGLKFLDLGYNRFKNESCSSNISDAFFEPIANVAGLSLEGTQFLFGHEAALIRLKKLIYLDISALYQHRKCPAKTKDLFNSIPDTVELLSISHWESTHELHKDCLITDKSVLGGLRRLKLQHLSFAYSDGIFGPILMNSTIPAFKTLKKLDLSYCRLNSIEKDVLSNYPNLEILNISGNALGPSNIDFVTHPLLQLKILHLRRASIRSDEYLFYIATNMIRNFPNLHTIDFSSNYLRRLPAFVKDSPCNASSFPTVEIFLASNCNIEEFVQLNSSCRVNICDSFRNLKRLVMYKNVLKNLHQLEKCAGLEELDVYQNQLGIGDQTTNALVATLLHLKHLTWLNLGSNGFRVINGSLLHNMPNLTKFYFFNNNIEGLDNRFFSKNPKLLVIDLSDNYLQYMHHSLFEGLPSLELLDLRGNQIATFAQDLLSLLSAYSSLGFFGISHNPYYCGCNTTSFQLWLKKHDNFTGAGKDLIICDSPPELKGTLVLEYKPSQNSYDCVTKDILIVVGCIVVTFFITVVIGIPCYKYRWYVQHIKLVWNAFRGSMDSIKLEHTCLYDAFISYDPKCEEDGLWVVNELMSAIESGGKSGLRLYVEQRDALPGTNKYTEREVALTKSRRILIVVSNSYLRSADCLSEADLSGLQMHGVEFYQPNRVMLLIREDLNEEIIRPPMTSLLQGKTLRVEYNPSRKERMWEKVRKFVSCPLYKHERRRKDNALTERSADYTDKSLDISAETTPLLH